MPFGIPWHAMNVTEVFLSRWICAPRRPGHRKGARRAAKGMGLITRGTPIIRKFLGNLYIWKIVDILWMVEKSINTLWWLVDPIIKKGSQHVSTFWWCRISSTHRMTIWVIHVISFCTFIWWVLRFLSLICSFFFSYMYVFFCECSIWVSYLYIYIFFLNYEPNKIWFPYFFLMLDVSPWSTILPYSLDWPDRLNQWFSHWRGAPSE